IGDRPAGLVELVDPETGLSIDEKLEHQREMRVELAHRRRITLKLDARRQRLEIFRLRPEQDLAVEHGAYGVDLVDDRATTIMAGGEAEELAGALASRVSSGQAGVMVEQPGPFVMVAGLADQAARTARQTPVLAEEFRERAGTVDHLCLHQL